MSDYNAVKVAVRECPLPANAALDGRTVNLVDNNKLVVQGRAYAFDHTFGPNSSQEQVFDTLCKPLLGKFLEGYNITLLAYGQTGTGKSYSMGLDANRMQGEQAGIVPRVLSAIFDMSSGHDAEREFNASFIEIYSERAYDLLSENPASVVTSRNYKNITRKPVSSEGECLELLIHSTKSRHVRATNMNSQSSRSHAIFTISTRLKKGDQQPVRSYLNLVDLAGTEGLRRTGNFGVAFSEGAYINQGLLCLGRVMTAIAAGQKVPFRDSVLTTLLQDSLNTNAIITLLACISSRPVDIQETMSTIRFANGTKQIKISPDIAKQTFRVYMQTPRSKISHRQSASTVRQTETVNTGAIPKMARTTIAYRNKNAKAPRFNQTDIGLTPKEKCKIEMQRLRRLAQADDLSSDTASSSSNDLQKSEHTLLTPLVQRCLQKNFPAFFEQLQCADGTKAFKQNMLQMDNSTDIELSRIEANNAKKLFMTSSPIVNSSESCNLNFPPPPPPARRSGNASAITRRRSTRLQKKVEKTSSVLATVQEESKPTKNKSTRKKRSSASFVLPAVGTNSTRKQRFNSHKAKLLQVINEGSIKQLQYLQLIGKKMAMQIITHRNLHGPFKRWTQVAKLPVWRNVPYEQFALANALL